MGRGMGWRSGQYFCFHVSEIIHFTFIHSPTLLQRSLKLTLISLLTYKFLQQTSSPATPSITSADRRRDIFSEMLSVSARLRFNALTGRWEIPLSLHITCHHWVSVDLAVDLIPLVLSLFLLCGTHDMGTAGSHVSRPHAVPIRKLAPSHIIIRGSLDGPPHITVIEAAKRTYRKRFPVRDRNSEMMTTDHQLSVNWKIQDFKYKQQEGTIDQFKIHKRTSSLLTKIKWSDPDPLRPQARSAITGRPKWDTTADTQ